MKNIKKVKYYTMKKKRRIQLLKRKIPNKLYVNQYLESIKMLKVIKMKEETKMKILNRLKYTCRHFIIDSIKLRNNFDSSNYSCICRNELDTRYYGLS